MLKSGEIVRTGYDQYMISTGKARPVYSPDYSETASAVMARIAEKYPYIACTVLETVLMNEFLISHPLFSVIYRKKAIETLC